MNGSGTITYRQLPSFCNKPGCRKCREGIGHGPYWYAYQTINGRTVRTYIGKTLPPDIQGPSGPETTTTDPAGAAPLRLYTLGRFRLERRVGEAWQVVNEAGWQVPAIRSLLACLISQPGRRLSSARALELLWPDFDTEAASEHLRRTFSALRQLLGNSAQAGQAHVRREHDMLFLSDQSALWADADAFEELLAREASSPDPTATEALLEEANALYGGDFFPEERNATWAQKRREALRRKWIGLLLELADLRIAHANLSPAIGLLDRLLAIDATNEAAAQRLMIALARLTRRAEALKIYQRLANALRKTYHTEPAPDTHALYDAIQHGNETLFTPPSMGTQSGTSAASMSAAPIVPVLPASPASTSEIYIGRANQSPLVGRDSELVSLRDLLAAVEETAGQRKTSVLSSLALKARRPQFLTLIGEAGIGKTRLAEETAREARDRGWNVVWSHAYPQESGIPYRLWTEALRRIVTQGLWQGQDIAQRVLTYAPLRALLPEIQEFMLTATRRDVPTARPVPDLVGARDEALTYEYEAGGVSTAAPGTELAGSYTYEMLSPEQEQLRLREAIYEFLVALSSNGPLLLALDDIQWTDDSSSQMLGYLARRLAGHPVVVLATCRESELADNVTLQGLISHMQREHAVETLHLQPLTDDQIGALVSYLPVPAVHHIQSQAAGNPFFAEELAHSLQSDAGIAQATPDQPSASTTAQTDPALISPPGRAEASDISAAARFPASTTPLPNAITAALDQRLNRLSRACRQLLGNAAVLGGSFGLHLISAIEASGSHIDEDTVLDLLDEALRSGLLTEEGSGTRITYHFWHPLLASHLYNGLSATRRARLHRRTAEVLQQVYRNRESEGAAAITRHLVNGGAEATQIAHFAELAGHAAFALPAYPEAERYYRLAVDHTTGATLEASLHLAFLLERLAECVRIQGNFKEARTLFERTLEARSQQRTFSTPTEAQQEAQIQAIIWSEIGSTWRYTGDTRQAHHCLERGEQALHAAGIMDGPAWGRLRFQQASTYWQEGNYAEAERAARASLTLFAEALARRQDTASTLPLTRTRLTLLGDPVDLGRAHALLGSILNATGQRTEALNQLNMALTIYEQYDRQRETSHVSCSMGYMYLTMAEYGLAQSFLRRALSIAERIGDEPITSVILHNMGDLSFINHNLTEAESLYRRCLAYAEQFGDREYISLWNADLAAVLQAQDKFADAAACVRRALSIGRAMRNAPCTGSALVALANLRIAQAARVSSSSASSASAQPASLEHRCLLHARIGLRRALTLPGLEAATRTRARLSLAQVSLLLGEVDTARLQATQACEEAQKYELIDLLARCQQLLKEIPANS